jgi:hypothetical protein
MPKLGEFAAALKAALKLPDRDFQRYSVFVRAMRLLISLYALNLAGLTPSRFDLILSQQPGSLRESGGEDTKRKLGGAKNVKTGGDCHASRKIPGRKMEERRAFIPFFCQPFFCFLL